MPHLPKHFHREVKKLLLNAGLCHIPYPDSLLRRIKVDDCEKLFNTAQQLSSLAPQDKFRQDLVIWMEYLLRFKKFYDLNASGNASVSDVDELLNWIHRFRDSRVFVHSKYDTYFGRVKEVLAEKRQWLHFDLDWEDKYILRHRELL